MRSAGFRRVLVGLLALSAALTACSNTSENAASADGTEAAETTDRGQGTGSAVDPADPDSEKALASALEPVEAEGYRCEPVSASPSGAARATCSNDDEVAVEAYAWVDAEAMSTGAAEDLACPDDSPLTQLTSLRGENWVLALVPGDGATVESQAAIDVFSARLQDVTQQPVAIQPCMAPEPIPTEVPAPSVATPQD